ncbi:hypothetical protein ACWCPT_29630 [Streptomyces sp. NPDC002308]
MRSNRPTTSQTSCDYEDDDYKRCQESAVTGHVRQTTVADQAAAHDRSLAADGWGDVEGRDYCPDHNPTITR